MLLVIITHHLLLYFQSLESSQICLATLHFMLAQNKDLFFIYKIHCTVYYTKCVLSSMYVIV